MNEDLIDFVLEHGLVPYQTLKDKILKIMKNYEISGHSVYKFLIFIESKNIKEALSILPRFIHQKS